MVTETDHLAPLADLLALLKLLHSFTQECRPHSTLTSDLCHPRHGDVTGPEEPGEYEFEVPPEEFQSKKLVNKLIQQVHDPVVLASGALPDWSQGLTLLHRYLFPFEVRELFFGCTAFGTSK